MCFPAVMNTFFFLKKNFYPSTPCSALTRGCMGSNSLAVIGREAFIIYYYSSLGCSDEALRADLITFGLMPSKTDPCVTSSSPSTWTTASSTLPSKKQPTRSSSFSRSAIASSTSICPHDDGSIFMHQRGHSLATGAPTQATYIHHKTTPASLGADLNLDSPPCDSKL